MNMQGRPKGSLGGKNNKHYRALVKLPYAENNGLDQPHIIVKDRNQGRNFDNHGLKYNIYTTQVTNNGVTRLYKLRGPRPQRKRLPALTDIMFVNV